MSVLLGETLSSFSGPLQTITFTYKPPYEYKPSSTLPSSKPITPQAYAEFGSSPSKAHGFSLSPDLGNACQAATVLYANVSNYDSTSRTLYYEVYIGGTKYSSGSGTMGGNTSVKFYSYPYSLYPINTGSWVELYLWTNASAAILQYICIYAIPSRLMIKPGYLLKDITITQCIQPVLQFGSDSYTVYSALNYPWIPFGENIIANIPGYTTVNIPFFPHVTQYGLFRSGLGDKTPHSGGITSTSATQVDGCYTPASISYRVTPIRA